MFIFRAIKKIIATALKATYRLLCVFNLQFTILLVLVGILLWALGVFEEGGFPLIIFVVLFIGSILLALYLTVRKILGLDKKKKKKSTIQIVANDQTAQEAQTVTPSTISQTQMPIQTEQNYPAEQFTAIEQETPKYYRVKQNSNYIMAEYSNRYELFVITPQGLKKIRTDYKR